MHRRPLAVCATILPLRWERKSGGGTGLRAALHQHIHWAVDVAANLPICQFAHPPSRQCAHDITNVPAVELKGNVLARGRRPGHQYMGAERVGSKTEQLRRAAGRKSCFTMECGVLRL